MTASALLWEHRFKVAVLIIAFLCSVVVNQLGRIERLRSEFAAKPKVEIRYEKAEAEKTTAGPVRTVERFVTVPGKCDPVLIERVIEAAPVVTERVVEVINDRIERPTCPTRGQYQFLVGAGANPARAQDGQMLHIGLGVGDRLDLSYGHSFPNQPERHDIRFMTRW